MPLYLHGVMESEVAPGNTPISAADLAGIFRDPQQKCFLADASHAARVAVRFRKRDVGFATPDALTRKFVPPPAQDVPAVLPIVLRLVDEYASASRTRAEVVLTAFVGYQALLTLHPFPDCNGRVARMFFSSCLSRGMVESPAVLLSLPLMLRGGAFEYHAASWDSRAGDHTMLLELFTLKLREADAAFGDFFQRASACEATSQTATVPCWRQLRKTGMLLPNR